MTRQKNTQFHIQHTTCDIRPTIYDRLIEFCLISLIIFTPLAYGVVQPWSIAVFEVTAALMFLFWIFKILANGKFEFVRNPLIFFIFLFIPYVSLQLFSKTSVLGLESGVSGLGSDVWGLGSVYRWATKTELLKVISYTLIFFVTLNTIKTRRQITRILSIIITVGFVMSIFFLMRYFGANAPHGFINPDHYSGYLGMIIPLAFGFLFISQQSYDMRDTTYAKRFLLLFCIVVMGTALFFTMSRGSMFSFIAALLFMAGLVLTRKSIKKKGWVLSVVVIFIILTIAWLGATPVVERILSVKVEIASRYFGGRLPIWQGTIDIIKDYPIFGTGFGTFNYIFPKYQPSKIITKHYTYAHSDFLELLSEVGIIGFSLFVICGLLSVVWLFRRFCKRHDPYVIGMSIGIFGSLASIFVHSFVDFNLHIPANAILLTIILSLFLLILNYKQDGVFSLRNTQPDCRQASYPIRNTRFVLYPITVLLVSIFIITSAKPAIADYYFQKLITDNRLQVTDNKALLARAIAFDPTNAAYHYQLGKLYSKRNTIYDMTKENPERSRGIQNTIDAYKEAVRLNPTNSKYYQSLAWTYGQLADLKNLSTYCLLFPACRQAGLLATNNAHKHFQQAIRLEPNNSYRYRAYAIWLFNHPSEENIKKAVAAYMRAVEIEPTLAEEALTKYYKYLKDYENPIDILPGTEESDYKVLRFLIKEEGLKFAIDFAEKFLKTYPHNAKIHFWIADRSFYDKDYPWEFTERHYKVVFKNDPKNAYYKMWHGIHLCHRHEYKKALKDLKMALELGLDPKSEKQAKKFVEKCKANMLNTLSKKNQKI